MRVAIEFALPDHEEVLKAFESESTYVRWATLGYNGYAKPTVLYKGKGYEITDVIGYRCPKCGRGNFITGEDNCVYCGEKLIKSIP